MMWSSRLTDQDRSVTHHSCHHRPNNNIQKTYKYKYKLTSILSKRIRLSDPVKTTGSNQKHP